MRKLYTKEYVGLNTYLYLFPLTARKEYLAMMDKLSSNGQVKIFFFNDYWGFEYKRNRVIDIA